MCAHCFDIPEGMRSVVVENAFDKETNNDLDRLMEYLKRRWNENQPPGVFH